MNNSIVIEWSPFQIAAGMDEAKLLQASEVLQTEFLRKQPGFPRRELLRGPSQQWVDLVYWENRAAADAAAQNAANSPVCYAYFQMMDADHAEPGAGVLHFDQVKTYPA